MSEISLIQVIIRDCILGIIGKKIIYEYMNSKRLRLIKYLTFKRMCLMYLRVGVLGETPKMT
ncbi:hypothetical protein C2G38_2101056 [Gigaspora rosea]|uniref:Uncharacterized protein n=1 Tax=Gigaspora rosea TaxID=44941 RepID=A0A397UXY8_9GLOM|nr:hypothetical protein C2G38_2101056 [Gigaspora rosea]